MRKWDQFFVRHDNTWQIILCVLYWFNNISRSNLWFVIFSWIQHSYNLWHLTFKFHQRTTTESSSHSPWSAIRWKITFSSTAKRMLHGLANIDDLPCNSITNTRSYHVCLTGNSICVNGKHLWPYRAVTLPSDTCQIESDPPDCFILTLQAFHFVSSVHKINSRQFPE